MAEGDSSRQCSACQQMLGVDSFSKKQWIARAYSRRCTVCVETGIAPQASMEQDELCALVKAVKFAEPHADKERVIARYSSQSEFRLLTACIFTDRAAIQVCEEITAQLAKHGRAPVPHAAIKKAWAALGLDAPEEAALKLFTIGKSSCEGVSGAAVGAGGVQEEGGEQWAPVVLDVGGVRNTISPYQAVISLWSGKGGASHAADGTELFKIQTAGPPGLPMLCYNKTRNKQTMIHDDTPGYARIHALISDAALTGVLGTGAGRKAYFFGQPHPENDKAICINISRLSSPQDW